VFGYVQILPNVELGSLSLKQILKCQSQSVLTGTSFENLIFCRSMSQIRVLNIIKDKVHSILKVLYAANE